jgi:hypothetical protein
LADARYLHEIFGLAEVRGRAESYNALRHCGADTWQALKLGIVSRVDIDGALRRVCQLIPATSPRFRF